MYKKLNNKEWEEAVELYYKENKYHQKNKTWRITTMNQENNNTEARKNKHTNK